ncbi:MAG: aminotransferase class V-fold PLP-dependent enzyme [Phycisphaerae bacterium]
MTTTVHDRIIYLDNNATTRVDPAVIDAMLPYWSEHFGNAASSHRAGAAAAAGVEKARADLARAIGARDSEIVFTSGGTEADNAALRGVFAARPDRRHLVVSAIEHHAVLETAEQLAHEGVCVTHAGVTRDGVLDLDQLASALRDDTALVAVMLANNETGVIQPLAQAAALAKARGALVMCDAVQALGKIAIQVDQLAVDLLTVSAHKLYGPKGAGALYVRRGTPFRPFILGGHQERDRRGGTQNTAGIVGLGAAAEIALHELPVESTRLARLRDRLEAELDRTFEMARGVGRSASRLPNTSCTCFSGVSAEAVLLLLSEAGVCVSSGAACSSGSLEPSHVLRAMGIDAHDAQGQIRFSFGRFNDDSDIDALLEILPAALQRVSALNAGA